MLGKGRAVHWVGLLASEMVYQKADWLGAWRDSEKEYLKGLLLAWYLGLLLQGMLALDWAFVWANPLGALLVPLKASLMARLWVRVWAQLRAFRLVWR
jgi:hypothetical protein